MQPFCLKRCVELSGDGQQVILGNFGMVEYSVRKDTGGLLSQERVGSIYTLHTLCGPSESSGRGIREQGCDYSSVLIGGHFSMHRMREIPGRMRSDSRSTDN